jgi:RimJ/RimL family protein N-acetyltransferase
MWCKSTGSPGPKRDKARLTDWRITLITPTRTGSPYSACVTAPGPVAPVRELTPADRDDLRRHFLALDSEDRLLRFGSVTTDTVIASYVAAIDFVRDTIFGIYDEAFNLVGVGHLAYFDDAGAQRTVEFGVSVLESARGRGFGTQLFERAAIRCRNTQVARLYMHYLSCNARMMHIARKAGMQINHAYGETDAYLTLAPADTASVVSELVQEQAAVCDCSVRSHARDALQWMKIVSRGNA